MTVVDRLDELQASSVGRVSPAHGRRAVATAQAHVMEVSRGSGVCAASADSV